MQPRWPILGLEPVGLFGLDPQHFQELRAFCTGQISRQKIPRYWKMTDAFPLTGSGKVQKFLLREQAIKDEMLAEEALEIQADRLLARINNPKRTRRFWR